MFQTKFSSNLQHTTASRILLGVSTGHPHLSVASGFLTVRFVCGSECFSFSSVKGLQG